MVRLLKQLILVAQVAVLMVVLELELLELPIQAEAELELVGQTLLQQLLEEVVEVLV